MKKSNDSAYIMQYLEEAFPNRLPLGKTGDFDLGILVGQQLLIEKLKLKLNIIQEQEQEIK